MQIIGVGGALCDQRIVVINRSVRQLCLVENIGFSRKRLTDFRGIPNKIRLVRVRFWLYQRNAKRYHLHAPDSQERI